MREVLHWRLKYARMDASALLATSEYLMLARHYYSPHLVETKLELRRHGAHSLLGPHFTMSLSLTVRRSSRRHLYTE